MSLLEVAALGVTYDTQDGALEAVRDLTLTVESGECVAIVGESGAGKSQALLAIMGLLDPPAHVYGSARFMARELVGAEEGELDRIRGGRLAMIFQDPMTSLTPHLTVGEQLTEALVRHRKLRRAQVRPAALALLEAVRMTDAERRLDQYPHELSGGMRQRALLAVALAGEPALLLADEPTTALDVTVQAQILALLAGLKRDRGLALLLVTHDLGVAAGVADRIAVMYAGRLVETGTAAQILSAPRHPYTRALLAAVPRLDAPADTPLAAVRGQSPDPRTRPRGCAFHPRCERAADLCRAQSPRLEDDGGSQVACHYPLS